MYRDWDNQRSVGEQLSNVQGELSRVHGDLELLLLAIRVDESEAQNLEIIKEIRNGSSYDSVLAIAARVVRQKGGFETQAIATARNTVVGLAMTASLINQTNQTNQTTNA